VDDYCYSGVYVPGLILYDKYDLTQNSIQQEEDFSPVDWTQM
jgi:hypothetical protein